MATNRRNSQFWSRSHFAMRFLALTGLLAAGVGVLVALEGGIVASWDALAARLNKVFFQDGGALGAVYIILVGVTLFVLGLIVEAIVILRTTAGRRSASGVNSLVQVLLALAIFGIVNFLSFGHSVRFDWTRAQQFTLPAAIVSDLEKLHGETTIVVYQRHKTFGTLTDRPDSYDYAAERKVVEKVKDLVEQFREIGPRFRVVVLDVEEKGFDAKLAELTRDAPQLRKAIDAAPENSLFFYGDGKVQQLSFNEFYQLDKVASEKANGGRGNLVLLAQGLGASGRGVEPFARKILATDERRPRIGVLVVHELLTTEGSEDAFSLKGLRRALETNGFDVRDIVLRKGWEAGQLEPAADTIEESKLERLDVELEELDASIKPLEEEIDVFTKLVTDWTIPEGADSAKKLDELSKKYARQLSGRRITESFRRTQLAYFGTRLTRLKEALDDMKAQREETLKERGAVNVDRVAESRRMTDVKAKLSRSIADCDLLFVPRLTRRANGSYVPNRAHKLEEEQVAAIREFLASGKPVFFSVGPTNEPRDAFSPPEPPGGDPLEALLGELGVRLGKHTVLFNADAKAFAADRRSNPLRAGGTTKVPTLDFDGPTEAALGSWLKKDEEAGKLPANPLREALKVTAHSVGDNFDLRLRFPRPVLVDPEKVKTPKFDPIFLVTAEGWNDDQPFPTPQRIPRYEPPKPDDPTNNTPDEKRRGPFPIGVAFDASLPAAWTYGVPKEARIAVIGQGEVFVGTDLSPARERLFLQVANWLIGRDDYLPRADHPWSYPRIELSPLAQGLWSRAMVIGLPMLFAYLGFVVLLARRLR